ncbi:hypothetical protein GJ689_21315 [Rhodoplanes serenus]|jgi:hypothetical protein|uniref:Uncharacterized protein n=1 Tax=Rhodoplanes serenus TaxID=200615 RepID=A0A327JR20_9BRAD|nr:hypothetical protein [Rhodoplanes serenus]MTW18745.1 hypothetical protein [Rhodoplanes serenus]RAI28727.1 hypothetical protein CH340_23400 [Rhodoplanes serenus]
MSTSKKTPSSIRQGGPGSSHQDAHEPRRDLKPPPDDPQRTRSDVSGGGGVADRHHTHEPERKGGGTRPAH